MSRGVILVHVLILVAMMGFMSALTLKWTMARHVAAKQSLEGNENRFLLAAAQAKVFTCLGQDKKLNQSTCALESGSTTASCLGSPNLKIGNRSYNYKIFLRTAIAEPAPPCRICISVCEASDISCPQPTDSSCPAPTR